MQFEPDAALWRWPSWPFDIEDILTNGEDVADPDDDEDDPVLRTHTTAKMSRMSPELRIGIRIMIPIGKGSSDVSGKSRITSEFLVPESSPTGRKNCHDPRS